MYPSSFSIETSDYLSEFGIMILESEDYLDYLGEFRFMFFESLSFESYSSQVLNFLFCTGLKDFSDLLLSISELLSPLKRLRLDFYFL